MLIRFFSSLRLTLFLLLALALAAGFGTLPNPEGGRFDLFFRSPWFRGLLVLLALNLLVCTVRTVRRKIAEQQRLFALLAEGTTAAPVGSRLVGPIDARAARHSLRRLGWRVSERDGDLLARRNGLGRWGSTVVHLSLLVIMTGALVGGLGFVGTLNMYVGDQRDEYFDWDRQQDLPLGFTVRLDAFEPVYYPLELRFAAVDRQTGDIIETYTAREGERVELPDPGLSAIVRRFYPERELLVLGLYRDGIYLGEYRGAGGRHRLQNRLDPGFDLHPVAFRDPVLKQLHSEVSILEDGRVVERGVIEVNHPLTHRGVTIYQTAYDWDRFGSWSAGFQLSRDPGEPLVWFGCLLLVAGLLLAFAVRPRAVGLLSRDGGILLVALAGFRGEADRRVLARLRDSLAAGEAEEMPQQ